VTEKKYTKKKSWYQFGFKSKTYSYRGIVPHPWSQDGVQCIPLHQGCCQPKENGITNETIALVIVWFQALCEISKLSVKGNGVMHCSARPKIMG